MSVNGTLTPVKDVTYQTMQLWSSVSAILAARTKNFLAYLSLLVISVLQGGCCPGYDTQKGVCAAVPGQAVQSTAGACAP